jgi:hypothetical protein
VILGLSVTGCARTQPVYNVNNASVVGGTTSGLTQAQIRQAILKAAADREWIAKEAGDGHIVAAVYVRNHMAEVDINYGPNQYSITYKNSDNLLYDGTMIHRNYNKWIKLLDAEIKEELARS